MAKKQLTQEEISQIENDLQDKKSEKRRNAAKKIGKNVLAQLGDKLYAAYIHEQQDKRTWETQTEMIYALGRIGFKKALPDLKLIVEKNTPHDMITNAAARSYVRLKRESISDFKPVIELLERGNLSVLNGTLAVVAFDTMIASDNDIQRIIIIIDSKDEADISIVGQGDPREYLISAMSQWNRVACEKYIMRFVESPTRGLREGSILALKGKRSRFE